MQNEYFRNFHHREEILIEWKFLLGLYVCKYILKFLEYLSSKTIGERTK